MVITLLPYFIWGGATVLVRTRWALNRLSQAAPAAVKRIADDS
jgi:hypothetical protein